MTTRLVSPTLKTFLGLMIGLVANTATFAENSKIDDIIDEQNKKNYTKEEKHHARKRKNR
jgi:hypothetical protein